MTLDLNALKAAAAATGQDHTKTSAGGGDFQAPAEGRAMARFVGYIELGKHEKEFKGVKKVTAKVRLLFQIFGKKWPAKVIEGVEYPTIITIEENLSFTDRSAWPKLFARLNHKGTATTPVELLGDAYLIDIAHRKWARKGEDKSKPETWTGVDITTKTKEGAFNIHPPVRQIIDEETGDVTGTAPISVPPATAPYRAFIWDNPSIDQWQSLFIEGEYPERKDKDGVVIKAASTKNVIQAMIRKAVNFNGSPINHLLVEKGVPMDGLGDFEEEGPDDEAPAPASAPPAPARKALPKRTGFEDLDDDIPF